MILTGSAERTSNGTCDDQPRAIECTGGMTGRMTDLVSIGDIWEEVD